MRHIIFVANLNSEEDFEKLEAELELTRLDYTLSRATHSVSVEGSNDVVYTAKQVIQQAGFTVK